MRGFFRRAGICLIFACWGEGVLVRGIFCSQRRDEFSISALEDEVIRQLAAVCRTTESTGIG